MYMSTKVQHLENENSFGIFAMWKLQVNSSPCSRKINGYLLPNLLLRLLTFVPFRSATISLHLLLALTHFLLLAVSKNPQLTWSFCLLYPLSLLWSKRAMSRVGAIRDFSFFYYLQNQAPRMSPLPPPSFADSRLFLAGIILHCACVFWLGT